MGTWRPSQTEMGKEQYFSPASAEPLAKNRLFSKYHAQYPEHERTRIVDELVNGTSNHRVLFVTVAFGIGIDYNNIRRIIHIGGTIYNGGILPRSWVGRQRWTTSKGKH